MERVLKMRLSLVKQPQKDHFERGEGCSLMSTTVA